MRQLLPINYTIDANMTGHCNNHPPTVCQEEACTCCTDIIANAFDAAAAAGAGTAAVLRPLTLPLLLPHQPTASQPPGAGVARIARVFPRGLMTGAAPGVVLGCNTADATWVHMLQLACTTNASLPLPLLLQPAGAGVNPGGRTTGAVPGAVTPGGETPGGVTPGDVVPAAVTPGTAPGAVTPGAVAPGGVTPGAVTPGTVPGAGGVAPGGVVPGTVPGAVTPGGVAPGGVTPGGVAPGAVTPGGVVTPGVACSTNESIQRF